MESLRTTILVSLESLTNINLSCFNSCYDDHLKLHGQFCMSFYMNQHGVMLVHPPRTVFTLKNYKLGLQHKSQAYFKARIHVSTLIKIHASLNNFLR